MKIFIALGTQKFQLNRLLKKIDTLLDEKKISYEIMAQIGNSDYIPKNYPYERFMDKEKFNEYIDKCDLLITHSGVGTIIAGKEKNKPIIVFPRLAKYGEHVDNHQMQIAQAFSEQKLVLLCENEDRLPKIIEKAMSFDFKEYHSHRQNVINTINDFLNNQKK